MEALVHQREKNSINFSKARTIICLNLHGNHNNSYLFGNGKEVFMFKDDNEKVNFIGSISNGFGAIHSREVSL